MWGFVSIELAEMDGQRLEHSPNMMSQKHGRLFQESKVHIKIRDDA